MATRILLVDDDADSLAGLALLLEGWGYQVEQAQDGEEALSKALARRPDLVIADLVMTGMDGLTLASTIGEECPGLSVIILTGHATVDSAVAAMKQGIYDYLTKPVDTRRLRLLIEKAIEKTEIVREVTLLRRQLKEARGLGRLLGTSKPMQEIYRLTEMAAPTNAAVLVSGESGTGKELVARTIHELSPRRKGPFVAVNCSAIPETLLESELFGYEKGAFTGAAERRAGYFELADKGTIFLDEIAEMSPALQAKYLRVLQEGTLRRLGGKGEPWRADDGSHGVWRSYHPLEQVRVSWHADADGPRSLVDLHLAAEGDGTRVSLRHEPAGPDRAAIEQRWSAALDRLDALA